MMTNTHDKKLNEIFGINVSNLPLFGVGKSSIVVRSNGSDKGGCVG